MLFWSMYVWGKRNVETGAKKGAVHVVFIFVRGQSNLGLEMGFHVFLFLFLFRPRFWPCPTQWQGCFPWLSWHQSSWRLSSNPRPEWGNSIIWKIWALITPFVSIQEKKIILTLSFFNWTEGYFKGSHGPEKFPMPFEFEHGDFVFLGSKCLTSEWRGILGSHGSRVFRHYGSLTITSLPNEPFLSTTILLVVHVRRFNIDIVVKYIPVCRWVEYKM